MEGTIGIDRIIAMFHVHDDHLVVEEKGFQYRKFFAGTQAHVWQVYLHKNSSKCRTE